MPFSVILKIQKEEAHRDSCIERWELECFIIASNGYYIITSVAESPLLNHMKMGAPSSSGAKPTLQLIGVSNIFCWCH